MVGESLRMMDRRLIMRAGKGSMGLATPSMMSVLVGILYTHICILN